MPSTLRFFYFRRPLAVWQVLLVGRWHLILTRALANTLAEFGIRESTDLFWNGEPVARQALGQRFKTETVKQPQPEMHIRADRHVYYEKVAEVMALAAKAGLVCIGFVSDPATAIARP